MDKLVPGLGHGFSQGNTGAFVGPLAGAVVPHRHGKGGAVLPESKNLCQEAIRGFPETLRFPLSLPCAPKRITGHSFFQMDTTRDLIPGRGRYPRVSHLDRFLTEMCQFLRRDPTCTSRAVRFALHRSDRRSAGKRDKTSASSQPTRKT